jgi:hypothetical protein
MSDTDVLLKDPIYRRRWLLMKALEENVSLAQALQLAQAAEEFLIDTTSGITSSDWIHPSDAMPAHDLSNEITSATTDAFDAHSSVVSIDDVVRFLEQHGESVPDTDGKFLTDGRLNDAAEQLLARANRVRMQQGLPRFALLPGAEIGAVGERDKSAPTGRVAPKRPLSARERAEWARQVIELPNGERGLGGARN